MRKDIAALCFFLGFILLSALYGSIEIHVLNHYRQDWGKEFTYLFTLWLFGAEAVISVVGFGLGLLLFKAVPNKANAFIFGNIYAISVFGLVQLFASVSVSASSRTVLLVLFIMLGGMIFPWIYKFLSPQTNEEHRFISSVTTFQIFGLILALAMFFGGSALFHLRSEETLNEQYSRYETPLIDAAEKGDINEVRRILAKGININAVGYWGKTALSTAAYKGHKDIVSLLIEHGADLNTSDWNGGTPLSNSVTHEEIFKLLLDKGADINTRYNEGWTVLHEAALGYERNITTLLLAKGMNINSVDNNGQTPLHFVASRSEGEFLAFLIMKGSDITIKDKEGKTAFDLAVQSNSEFAPLFLPVSPSKSTKCQRDDLSEIERQFCLFPPLVNFAQKLNSAYSTALRATTMRKYLQRDQRTWLTERNQTCANDPSGCSTSTMMRMYIDQIKKLEQVVREPNSYSGIAGFYETNPDGRGAIKSMCVMPLQDGLYEIQLLENQGPMDTCASDSCANALQVGLNFNAELKADSFTFTSESGCRLRILLNPKGANITQSKECSKNERARFRANGRYNYVREKMHDCGV